MDTSIIAALISGFIALLGLIASFVISRSQIKLQSEEIALKQQEFSTATKRLESELEMLRQTQFVEILRKRIEVYPRLWSTVLKYTINWSIEKKDRDYLWAKSFLLDLNLVNNEVGIFFSQSVYETFHELRMTLIEIEDKLALNETVTPSLLERPNHIFAGDGYKKGLATFLKDDLGSYRSSIIQQRND